jgi:transposase InsO family protein
LDVRPALRRTPHLGAHRPGHLEPGLPRATGVPGRHGPGGHVRARRGGLAVRAPKAIRVDQGCQFTSKELDLWAYGRGVTLDFSRPGKPTDNAYIEAFNARVRGIGSIAPDLNQHWFMDLDDACRKLEDWRMEYNEVRPHGAIGDRPPIALLRQASGPPEATPAPATLA